MLIECLLNLSGLDEACLSAYLTIWVPEDLEAGAAFGNAFTAGGPNRILKRSRPEKLLVLYQKHQRNSRHFLLFGFWNQVHGGRA